MIAHRCDDCLRRERKIFLLEGAAERRRVLNEIENLLEKVGRDFCRTATFLRSCSNLLADHGAAPLRIDNDIRLFTRRLIVGRRSNDKVFGGKRTVSARGAAARNVCKRKGNDLRPVERDDPADRTDETEVQITPAHAVRQRNRTDEFRQELGEQLRRLCPLLMNGGIDISVSLNKRRRINPLSACKSCARFRRVPVCIKGD